MSFLSLSLYGACLINASVLRVGSGASTWFLLTIVFLEPGMVLDACICLFRMNENIDQGSWSRYVRMQWLNKKEEVDGQSYMHSGLNLDEHWLTFCKMLGSLARRSWAMQCLVHYNTKCPYNALAVIPMCLGYVNIDRTKAWEERKIYKANLCRTTTSEWMNNEIVRYRLP